MWNERFGFWNWRSGSWADASVVNDASRRRAGAGGTGTRASSSQRQRLANHIGHGRRSRQLEPEHRAALGAWLVADRAAHVRDQVLRDVETEAGAGGAAAVLASERREQLCPQGR